MIGNITRRRLGVVGVAGVTAAGFASLAAPAVFAESNMTKINVGSLPFLDFVPLYAAAELGYFKKERLDVRLKPLAGGAGGAAAFTALVAGDLQATISTTVADFVAAEKGLTMPMIGCGPATGAPPQKSTAALIAPKSADMMSGKAWNRKRIGINILDSIAWLSTRLWVDAHGGDSSTLSFVEIEVPALNAALLQGRIDAILQNEPFVSALVQTARDKVEVVSWVYPDVLPNSMIAALYASEEYIGRNREAISAFSRAYNKGVVWATENKRKPSIYALISSFTRLPQKKLEHMLGWPEFQTTISPAALLKITEAMEHYKLIQKSPDLRTLIFSDIRG